LLVYLNKTVTNVNPSRNLYVDNAKIFLFLKK
jgi:hypothetical protein